MSQDEKNQSAGHVEVDKTAALHENLGRIHEAMSRLAAEVTQIQMSRHYPEPMELRIGTPGFGMDCLVSKYEAELRDERAKRQAAEFELAGLKKWQQDLHGLINDLKERAFGVRPPPGEPNSAMQKARDDMAAAGIIVNSPITTGSIPHLPPQISAAGEMQAVADMLQGMGESYLN